MSIRPLRVLFIQTSMPVGGAEVLLVNLVRRMDRSRFAPEIACLKEPGPLGEEIAKEVPLHAHLIRGKYDLTILPRLKRLMRDRKVDAVVTVGAGDKMFWGRLAAKWAGVPVVASALHSTGWPDGVGRLNRMLTRWTDAFIAVAKPHGEHLVLHERFPAGRVHVIPNGVDTERFSPSPGRESVRQSLGVKTASPVIGILAALRPEKNHELFLHAAAKVHAKVSDARFMVIGDGPRRMGLEALRDKLGLNDVVQFLGSRSDVPELLSAIDILSLTSHNEANPVSILEAMSCGKPVVATDVGSVGETVLPGETGLLSPPGDAEAFAHKLLDLVNHPLKARLLGEAARRLVVEHWSLDGMVHGYEDLIEGLYCRKTGRVYAGQADLDAEPAAVSHS